ncbi:MAG TPA: helix-turn-helix transcriptional regulator [Gemmatimonadaceae bacterium]|nr:helix-turn-helix transcriptional regulator [Gemmatimonadaceae bacterium]
MTTKGREQLGDRIRRYRTDKGMKLTELADAAEISKGYLSNLENDPDHKRPSATTLYGIASALGVAMSDLLGEKLIIEQSYEVPDGLRELADEEYLPEADVAMLATIQFRGDKPRSKERWRHIYESIWMSKNLDQQR